MWRQVDDRGRTVDSSVTNHGHDAALAQISGLELGHRETQMSALTILSYYSKDKLVKNVLDARKRHIIFFVIIFNTYLRRHFNFVS